MHAIRMARALVSVRTWVGLPLLMDKEKPHYSCQFSGDQVWKQKVVQMQSGIWFFYTKWSFTLRRKAHFMLISSLFFPQRITGNDY